MLHGLIWTTFGFLNSLTVDLHDWGKPRLARFALQGPTAGPDPPCQTEPP
jgi:hypothetical protein